MRKTFKKTNFKSSNGITLIALVITIIVLLLLAGVAISMLSGENGILTKAQYAAQEQERANIQDLTIAGYYYKMIAATEDYRYLDMEKTAQGIYANLTSNGYKLEKTDGSIVTDANELLSSEEGVSVITLNVEGKHGDYKGEVTDTGLKKDIEIVGEIPEETPPQEPEQPEEPKVEVTIDSLKETGEAVTENITLIDENEQQIVIPANFRIASDSATTIKDGIVVVAPDESEFVWVPVEDINSMVMCQGSTGVNDCNIVREDNGELKCEKHADTLICGKLYATSTENKFNSTLGTQKYNAKSGLREPAVLTSTSDGDYVIGKSTKGVELIKSIVGITGTNDTDVLNKWQTQIQDEYEEMSKSVYENKGFYVGRYETSLKTLDDGTKVAQSIANVSSALADSSSANTWYGLYQKEKEYSTRNSLTDIVGSTMIWGSQYDQMMLWMKNNGIDITSTTPTNLEGITTSKNTTKVTGSKAEDKLNNIYDLLGNSFEWTLEAYDNYSRVTRGGEKSTSGYTPSYRDGYGNPNTTSSYDSSRVTLYIK